VRRVAFILCALAIAGIASTGWLAWRARGGGPVRVRWAPAGALAPGVSVREGKVSGRPAWRAVDVAIDPSRATLRVVSHPGGSALADMVPPGALAAVNGGYFDERYRPTGWLVDGSRELRARRNRSQGGVLALKKGALFIGPLADVPFAPELALQNSPRLVEKGGRVGIRSDDGKRASRTVACDAAGRLHLIVVSAPLGDGPTLLQTARFLAADPREGGMGCGTALNLDGGPSTSLWLPGAADVDSVPSRASIAYGLAVLPR